MLESQVVRERGGFFIYLSRTYRNMSPYLKGDRQTLDSWREGIDREGWKLERREMMLFLTSRKGEVYDDLVSEALENLYPATRLKSYLETLECLLEGT